MLVSDVHCRDFVLFPHDLSHLSHGSWTVRSLRWGCTSIVALGSPCGAQATSRHPIRGSVNTSQIQTQPIVAECHLCARHNQIYSLSFKAVLKSRYYFLQFLYEEIEFQKRFVSSLLASAGHSWGSQSTSPPARAASRPPQQVERECAATQSPAPGAAGLPGAQQGKGLQIEI